MIIPNTTVMPRTVNTLYLLLMMISLAAIKPATENKNIPATFFISPQEANLVKDFKNVDFKNVGQAIHCRRNSFQPSSKIYIFLGQFFEGPVFLFYILDKNIVADF